MRFQIKNMCVVILMILAMGCSAQDIENDWMLKGIVDTMPRSLQPGGYRDLQDKKKEQNNNEKKGRYQRWRHNVIINLDTKEQISDIGTTGEKWPDYTGPIEYFSNKDGFPENGYRVFQFEADELGEKGRYIKDFKVIKKEKDGIIYYEEVE